MSSNGRHMLPRSLAPTLPPTLSTINSTPAQINMAAAQVANQLLMHRTIARSCSQWFSAYHALAQAALDLQAARQRQLANAQLYATPAWQAYLAQCAAIKQQHAHNTEALNTALKAAKLTLSTKLGK